MADPAPVAVGDIFQIVVRQKLAEQRILNVFYWRYAIAGAITVYQDFVQGLADDFRTGFTGVGFLTEWRAHVSTKLSFEQVRVQRVSPTRDVYLAKDIDMDGLIDVGVLVNPIDTMSITKRTLRIGRRGVGRAQLAGWQPADVSLGKYAVDAVENATAAFQWLTSTWNPASADAEGYWVLYHPDAPGASYDRIRQVFAEPEVRTMHRRTVGLGI